tara:strand:+ start:896 stop:1099 length:204 start_codon:yes stop_codon:yes gene_type:complete
MKALAWRDPLPGYIGDFEDLQYLIKKMEISTVEEVQSYFNQYFADDILSQKQQKVLLQIINERNRSK